MKSDQHTQINGMRAQSCITQVRTVSFEKCFVVLPSHRERFSKLIETRQLVERLFPNLPEDLKPLWSMREFRRAYRLYIEILRDEVVCQGYSSELHAIGDFFALHNRQGSNPSEWYAGADIFIVPRVQKFLREECRRFFERPILESPWEVLEAAFGPAVNTFSIDLKSEFRDLGFETKGIPTELLGSIEIAEFEAPGEGSTGTRIYCSNGARHFGLSSQEGKGFGNEFVVQLPALSGEGTIGDLFSATVSPVRLMVGAWVLMLSAKSRTTRKGAGISLDLPLFKDSDSDLRTVMAVPYQLLKSEHLSREGPFYFMNIIGITDDEARFASEHSPELLLTLLRRRGLDQLTTPWRPGILARTEIRKSGDDQTPRPLNSLHE